VPEALNDTEGGSFCLGFRAIEQIKGINPSFTHAYKILGIMAFTEFVRFG
jgi:hypothetical protein